VVMKSNMYLLKIQIGDNPKLAKYLEEIDSAINQSDMLFEFSRSTRKLALKNLQMRMFLTVLIKPLESCQIWAT